MDRYPGIGERIKSRMHALGYWKKDGSGPDVMNFAKRNGFLPQYAYDWLKKDRMPDYRHMQELSRALDVPMAWLLLGDDAVRELKRWEEAQAPAPRRSAAAR